MRFFRAGSALYRLDEVISVDTSGLEGHEVTVHHQHGILVLTGVDAIELVMMLKPSAFEGRRLRWVRHAWSLHNVVGHPLMQLLAWVGRPRWGVWVHDVTTPRPTTK